ncbi:hypothetical protein GCM10007301_15630 [Azorhizobium oxalatiphilum]|uniref:Uncharacterized protein n=1 Tax=Azorhizobium oxalatiphilum TaxID=980631 RepID=A0A917F802_9HYPH|nr:hypothetical protein [Azorhizobium oxalatiphilum]GGF56811.1 hypothetical protein GCM10007301_15630 [Azorhizobium oxalatiphilum]
MPESREILDADLVAFDPAGDQLMVLRNGDQLYRVNGWDIIATAATAAMALSDLIGRMTVAPSSDVKAMMSRLIAELMAAGIWARLDALWILASHDAQAARLNWKSSAYNLTAINSPPFTVNKGYKNAPGTNVSYLTTGFTGGTAGDNWQLNSATAGVYSPVNGINDEGVLLGASDMYVESGLTDPGVRLIPRYHGSGGGGVNTTSNSSVMSLSPWTAPGSYIATRNRAEDTLLYENGTLRNTFPTPSRANSLPVYLLAENFGGGSSFHSDDMLNVAFVGGGLTQPQIATLHAALSRYLTSIGA